MISHYNFSKSIKENNNIYFLELVIPHSFSNFSYKIYGDDGFVQNGKYTFYKNVNIDNIIVISINKIQQLFLNIKLLNNIEYFDFINMSSMLINKNIKINIKKIIETEKELGDNDEEDDDEDDDNDNDEEDNDEDDEEDEKDDEEDDNDEEDEDNDENKDDNEENTNDEN